MKTNFKNAKFFEINKIQKYSSANFAKMVLQLVRCLFK